MVSSRATEDDEGNASITQACASWRLRRARVSYVSRFHDGTNAFYCIPFKCVLEMLPSLFRECDLPHARDRVLSVSFVPVDPRDYVHMRPGMGAFPGDHAATKIFVAAYSQALIDAQGHLWHCDVWDKYCAGTCIFYKSKNADRVYHTRR